ncbi:hypothetical protein [Rossellomorea vietnamensis]|nr:hypothetical protein [Rossellomorea vietnamensis]
MVYGYPYYYAPVYPPRNYGGFYLALAVVLIILLFLFGCWRYYHYS